MTDIRIPDYYIPGLEKIRQLDETDFNEVVAVVKSVTPSIVHTKFIDKLISLIQNIPPRDARLILDTSIWLVSGQIHLEMPINEFTDAVSQSSDLSIPADERQSLANRLTVLLGLEPLRLTWKAVNVITEHERAFIDARIMTDVRPVFGEDVSKTPQAVVLVHMLKMRYRSEQAPAEIFIALDNTDIQALRAVLDRAETKAKTLINLLNTTGLTYVEVE